MSTAKERRLRLLGWHSTWRTKWRVDTEPERRQENPFWDNPEPGQCPICGGRLAPPYPDYQIIEGRVAIGRCPCPEESVITPEDIASKAYYSLPPEQRPSPRPPPIPDPERAKRRRQEALEEEP
jgi:hypothetical protein